jgi:hypothetical protein
MSDAAATATYVQALLLLGTEEGALIDAFRRTSAHDRVKLARAIHTSLLLDGPTFSGGAPSSASSSATPSSAPARASRSAEGPAVKARPGTSKAASKPQAARGKYSPVPVMVPSVAELLTVPKATSASSTPMPTMALATSAPDQVAATALDLFDSTPGDPILVDADSVSPTDDEPAASAAPPDVPRGPWGMRGPVCNKPCTRNCGNRCPRRDNLGMSRSHEKHECRACRKLTKQGL